ISFIDRLQANFEKMKLDVPISLSLTANIHTISLNYNPKKKQWLLVDANQLDRSPITINLGDNPLDTAIAVSKEIDTAFNKDNPLSPIVMKTNLCVTKDHADRLQTLMQHLNEDNDFKKLFNVTEKNANSTVPNKALTWLEGCVYDGNIKK